VVLGQGFSECYGSPCHCTTLEDLASWAGAVGEAVTYGLTPPYRIENVCTRQRFKHLIREIIYSLPLRPTFPSCTVFLGSRDSSIGIVTRLAAGKRRMRIEFSAGVKKNLFSTALWPTLGLTQLPMQWGPEGFLFRLNGRSLKLTTPIWSLCRVRQKDLPDLGAA
jgi:hypothetical protein